MLGSLGEKLPSTNGWEVQKRPLVGLTPAGGLLVRMWRILPVWIEFYHLLHPFFFFFFFWGGGGGFFLCCCRLPILGRSYPFTIRHSLMRYEHTVIDAVSIRSHLH
jgi:hypothetical protein